MDGGTTEQVREQLARFFNLVDTVEQQEALVKKAGAILKESYWELVQICPHSKCVQFTYTGLGYGPFRVCKICGIEDQASEGGTPGDEYNYGHAGHPNYAFWADSCVEETDDKKYFESFRREHGWSVKDGSPYHF
jgi:hypothetical protein